MKVGPLLLMELQQFLSRLFEWLYLYKELIQSSPDQTLGEGAFLFE